MGETQNQEIKRDAEFEKALEPVLGFYATQLQSHAATIVSLAIGFFALITIKPSGAIGLVLAPIGAAMLTVLLAYSFIRLIVYGQLSKSILYGNLGSFARYRDNYRKDQTNKVNWDMMLPYTKVSYYANSHFLEFGYSRKYFGIFEGRWIFKDNAQPNRRLLVIIGLVSYAIALLLFVSS